MAQKLNVRRSASLQDLITAAWAALLAGRSDPLLLRRAIHSAGPYLDSLPLPLLVQLGQVTRAEKCWSGQRSCA